MTALALNREKKKKNDNDNDVDIFNYLQQQRQQQQQLVCSILSGIFLLTRSKPTDGIEKGREVGRLETFLRFKKNLDVSLTRGLYFRRVQPSFLIVPKCF